jgi:hypothetical protein
VTTRRALFAAALALASTAAQAGDVWVATSTEKVRPTAQKRSDTAAHLGAARNEFEAFQVVVTGPAKNVTASASALEGAGRIDRVRLYRVDTIDVRNPSALDGGTGRWPDALVPDVDDVANEKRNAFPFDVAAGESRAIWVEIYVPKDARPGSYQGSVTVTSAEGEARIPVDLVVWDFELPSTSSLRTSFGLSYGGLRSAHHTDGDAESALRARYATMGLDHRITLTGLADDGRNSDLGNLDRFYGPLLDGTAATTLPGARLTTMKYVGDRNSVGEHRAWAQHAREKGWFDRLFDYTCDEPPLTCRWDEIPSRAKAAHDADPEFKTLVTTQVWDAEDHGVLSSIDVLVPVVNWTWDKPGSPVAGDQRGRYDGFLKGQGKELWLYQSCMSHGCGGTVNMGSPSDGDRYFTGWPSYMIDASAVRNRAMEWITFAERATGELYWETTMAYGHDAWSNQWDFSGNGDGTLFYPGTPSRIGGSTDVPVASIRLKMIREGMEDYEYLKALADAGDADFATKTARSLFPTAYQAEVDAAAVLAARETLAHRILALRGKPVPASMNGGAAMAAAGGCGTAGAGAGLLALAPVLLAALGRRRRG